MSQNFKRYAVWKLTLVVLAGMAATLLAGPLSAQTKDKDTQAKEAVQPEQLKEPTKAELLDAPRVAKKSTLIKAGYTRPGNPSDRLQDGKVLSIAWDDDYKGRYIGATVYFAVYERSELGVLGDFYGTGHPGIDDLFKEGRSTAGQYSPGLDTSARFLYVYQIVNDRGLDPMREVPIGAAWRNFRTEDIVSATVKLLVDCKAITSWGHFKNTAFAGRVADRDLRGKVQLAADGKSDRMLAMAFSSNPAVLDALPVHEYMALSPELPLHDLRNYFGMERSSLNLSVSKAYRELNELKTKGVALTAWQENMLAAAKGGMEPAYVQLNGVQVQPYGPFGPSGRFAPDAVGGELLPVGQNVARGYLKVDWRGDQILKLGDHSVVFGFTSNLPPGDEVVRVISAVKQPAAGIGAEGIGSVALIDGEGPGVGVGQIVGPGTVPTPVGFPAENFGGGGFWLGSPFGGFGGGTAFPFGGIGGGGYMGREPLIGGGGGGGGGSGSGNGSGSNNGNQSQSGQQSGSQTITITNTNTLVNQQAQFQAQAQAQAQSQRQHQHQHQSQNHNHMPGHVVPEPAALALGLLGLPALYVVLRRRKGTKVPAAVI
jgi:hypothetical protein